MITWFSVMTVTVAPLIASTPTEPAWARPHLDLVAGGFADVLTDEVKELRFRNSEEQNRFAVLKNLDSGDDPFGIYSYQGYHGFP